MLARIPNNEAMPVKVRRDAIADAREAAHKLTTLKREIESWCQNRVREIEEFAPMIPVLNALADELAGYAPYAKPQPHADNLMDAFDRAGWAFGNMTHAPSTFKREDSDWHKVTKAYLRGYEILLPLL